MMKQTMMKGLAFLTLGTSLLVGTPVMALDAEGAIFPTPKSMTTGKSADGKYNVVLIMTDDQGYPDLGCHGNPAVRTPHMDKLAAGSVRFCDFHVNPFCSPTRAALMTGRMSDRTGVTRTNFQRNYLRRDEILMPEYFKASGYRTGIFGKWHIGGNYPYRPMDRGFDEWVGLGNNGLATTADLWDNDRMNDRYWHNGRIVRLPGFSADVYFREAMRFIRESKGEGKPFFAYIATNVPHWNWNVPSEWLTPYLETCSRDRAAFYASISRVDWNLGRLTKLLEEEELLDDTILVFLTDNGSDVPDKANAYTAGMRGFKGSRYEGGHRVPCFIRASEKLVGKPREIDGLTGHVDLMPTFIDLCGLRKPDRRQLPLDGRSLRPLLTGDGEWPDRMFVVHHHNEYTPQKHLNGGIMTSAWRLIMVKPDKFELYRIKEDRGQKTDVAAEYPDVVERLLKGYDEHWSSLRLDRPLERPVMSRHATLRLSSDLAVDRARIEQRAVRQGVAMQLKWLLEAAEKGRYRLEVRRWPREADAAMTAGLPPAGDPDLEYIGRTGWKTDIPGVALEIEEVELKLSGRKTLRKRVTPVAKRIVFEVDLDDGEVDLEAWFVLKGGKRIGAYFVYADQI
jgi:arylsulfatase A-like enzyme